MSADQLSPKTYAKWISLICLTFQTTILVLTVHHSRDYKKAQSTTYLITTAVLLSETAKLICNVLILWVTHACQGRACCQQLNREIVNKPQETIKLFIPAALYALQNNLLFLALSNLESPIYQVTYQLRILTAAIFSVLLISKKVTRLQWFSLAMLVIGVSMTQFSYQRDESQHQAKLGSRLIGLLAVLTACMTSGLAGVYFEMVVKDGKASLWIRNIQLGMFSVLCCLLSTSYKDWDVIKANGFLQGYDSRTWLAIAVLTTDGIIVSTVMKYADNILKNFCSGIAIILIGLISWLWIQDFNPTLNFFVGTAVILTSTFLYNWR